MPHLLACARQQMITGIPGGCVTKKEIVLAYMSVNQ